MPAPFAPHAAVDLIRPMSIDEDPLDGESLDVWGFRDTRFEARPDGIVVLSGSRYELSGRALPDLLPWARRTIHPDFSPSNLNATQYPPPIPAPIRNSAFLEAATGLLGTEHMSEAPEIRLRHGHGHTLEEMWAIKFTSIRRVPDLVVWPADDAQVESLVELALRHDVVLIPYGGGTNVMQALQCPEGEQRSIVSVDMSRMNRVLWIDPVNRLAHVQAGAVGRHLARVLAEHGFTMGHEPDSVEFSTLGGWIATHCSGMKKNRYGNIEDLVLDVSVVTTRGRLERFGLAPRESVGSTDIRRWIFGSEGCLGIITSAVVKIFPLPEAQAYGSIVFPDFESGVRFLYELQQQGNVPASVRLVDNLQFQLAQMLKPRPTPLRAVEGRIQKLVLTHAKRFDLERIAACTLVFEGAKAEVGAQKRRTHALAKRHRGLAGGESNGRRGYQLTFGIAYIRDWILRHHCVAESFETSVPWSNALQLCENVKRRIFDECASRGVPGRPFVTCRVTQIYSTGVCVYFYLAFYAKGIENPVSTFAEVERAARDEILRSGGSLSHHHGIGKLRQRFLSRVVSPGVMAFAREIKRAVDPSDVFGAANQLFGDEEGAA